MNFFDNIKIRISQRLLHRPMADGIVGDEVCYIFLLSTIRHCSFFTYYVNKRARQAKHALFECPYCRNNKLDSLTVVVSQHCCMEASLETSSALNILPDSSRIVSRLEQSNFLPAENSKGTGLKVA
jgi:hypothetical protein